MDGIIDMPMPNPRTTIAAAYVPATGLLSLTGTDTYTNYQQVLRSVIYNNSSITPTTTSIARPFEQMRSTARR